MSLGTVLFTVAMSLVGLSVVLTFLGVLSGSGRWDPLDEVSYLAGCWLWFLSMVVQGEAALSAWSGMWAAYFTWRWWNGPRNRRHRKALRELGAKARARIEAMVRQITPSPIPSPAGG